jgi:hypothetical protein
MLNVDSGISFNLRLIKLNWQITKSYSKIIKIARNRQQLVIKFDFLMAIVVSHGYHDFL